MNAFRLLFASLLLVGALSLAACGGDDEGSGGEEASVESFCEEVAVAREEGNPLADVAEDDIDGAIAGVETYVEQVDRLVEVSPEEIKGDVEEFRDYFEDYLASIEGVATPEEFEATSQKFEADSPAPAEVSARIESYTNEECGEADTATDDSSTSETP